MTETKIKWNNQLAKEVFFSQPTLYIGIVYVIIMLTAKLFKPKKLISDNTMK